MKRLIWAMPDWFHTALYALTDWRLIGVGRDKHHVAALHWERRP
jgi:hypothetical protein